MTTPERRCASCRHWGAFDLTDAEIPTHMLPLCEPAYTYRWCHQDTTPEEIEIGDATISTACGSCDGWEARDD